MKPCWKQEHDDALLRAVGDGVLNTSAISAIVLETTGRQFSEMAIRRRVDRLRRAGHVIGPMSGRSKADPVGPIDVERFWAKADRSGGPDACWPWTEFCDKSSGGYGRFRVGDGIYAAHRVAYEVANGAIPRGGGPTSHGVCVLHSCDNPSCVNPRHLSLGSQLDNIDDRHSKGRTASGNDSGARRRPDRVARGDSNGTRTMPMSRPTALNEAQVAEVRRLLANGEIVCVLAAKFHVGHNTISRIKRGVTKKWIHATEVSR